MVFPEGTNRDLVSVTGTVSDQVSQTLLGIAGDAQDVKVVAVDRMK